MTESLNPANPDTESISTGDEAARVVADTLKHNTEVLAKQVEAISLLAAVTDEQRVDGKGYPAIPLNLYVDSKTGCIVDVKSMQQEKRDAVLRGGAFIQSRDGIIKPVAPSEEVQSEHPTRAVILPAYYVSALPDFHANHPKDRVLMDRPNSWNRNDQVVLIPNLVSDDGPSPVEELIPDPIERGVLLQSIDIYNHTSEPPEVSVSRPAGPIQFAA